MNICITLLKREFRLKRVCVEGDPPTPPPSLSGTSTIAFRDLHHRFPVPHFPSPPPSLSGTSLSDTSTIAFRYLTFRHLHHRFPVPHFPTPPPSLSGTSKEDVVNHRVESRIHRNNLECRNGRGKALWKRERFVTLAEELADRVTGGGVSSVVRAPDSWLKGRGFDPCRSGGRIFFSRVDFLC